MSPPRCVNRDADSEDDFCDLYESSESDKPCKGSCCMMTHEHWREIVLETARRVAVYFDEYLPDDVSCNRASRDAERIARNVAEEKGVEL